MWKCEYNSIQMCRCDEGLCRGCHRVIPMDIRRHIRMYIDGCINCWLTRDVTEELPYFPIIDSWNSTTIGRIPLPPDTDRIAVRYVTIERPWRILREDEWIYVES